MNLYFLVLIGLLCLVVVAIFVGGIYLIVLTMRKKKLSRQESDAKVMPSTEHNQLQTKFCPACGEPVDPGLAFCTDCGQDLALDAPIQNECDII